MSRRTYIFAKDPETGEHLKGQDGMLVLVEVGQDWSDAPRSTGDWHKFQYDNCRSPIDGTDISSRTKLKEHLKQHDATLTHEYKGIWEKAAKRRAEIAAGGNEADRRKRRDDIGRTIYQLEKQQSKRRR